MNMMIKNIIAYITLALLMFVLILSVNATVRANDDFSLRLTMNGDDISETETIVIDPELALTLDLRILDTAGDLTLRKLAILVTFAEQIILTQSIDLGNYHMMAGESYQREISIDAREVLSFGGRLLTTGIYRSQIKLEYTLGSQAKTWSQWKNIRILGNPLSTPVGDVGIIVVLGTIGALVLLAKSIVAPDIPKGMPLPSSASVNPMKSLYDLSMGRLESVTRGRVIANIVVAAKKVIVKDKCPVCGGRLKHGYCYTCKKSGKDIRREYTARLQDLALQAGQLITGGKVASLEELYFQLGVSPELGTQVIAILRNARLVKVKGLARKLVGKAVIAGIGTALSVIFWVTLGGLAFLSTSTMVIILIASVVIPLMVTWSLQMKARHDIRRSKQAVN